MFFTSFSQIWLLLYSMNIFIFISPNSICWHLYNMQQVGKLASENAIQMYSPGLLNYCCSWHCEIFTFPSTIALQREQYKYVVSDGFANCGRTPGKKRQRKQNMNKAQKNCTALFSFAFSFKLHIVQPPFPAVDFNQYYVVLCIVKRFGF